MTPQPKPLGNDQRLLKSVSRSFYLSIRLMPKALRPAIGVAYLLARASDTIADTESAPPATRLRRLAEFEQLIKGGTSLHAMSSIQRDIQPTHPGEKQLIAALPALLKTFQELDGWVWKETSDLLANIIRGQSMDLHIFTDPADLAALPDSASLEDYIYLVAGCVGEWWTKLCYHHLPDGKYSARPEATLAHLGANFGKALQLVNILRDMPADLAAGRCYLPADELQKIDIAPALLPLAPASGQPVFDHWHDRARKLLDQGRLYIMALRSRRIRMACYLPWRLGLDTLNLLAAQPPLTTGHKVKVPRAAVRKALIQSIHVAFSDKPLLAS